MTPYKRLTLGSGFYLISFAILLFCEPVFFLKHPVPALLSLGLLIAGILFNRSIFKRTIRGINSLIRESGKSEEKDLSSNTVELYENFFRRLGSRDSEISRLSSELAKSAAVYKGSTSRLADISNEQAAAVNEVVAVMEASGSVSNRISISIGEIYRLTASLTDSFNNGFGLIKESIVKMHEIESSNMETLKGIQFLSERIENIWDIVNIINEIADQTKIIAFNAELEASAAGEAGKNFRIVASEIRRLADSTVNSTNEIKVKINEIQHSSDVLIISSETGTERIKEGNRISDDLERVFKDVLNSIEIAITSTEEINDTVRSQVRDFEEILMTMKQISNAVETLSMVSSDAEKVSDSIDDIAVELKNCVNKEIDSDATEAVNAGE